MDTSNDPSTKKLADETFRPTASEYRSFLRGEMSWAELEGTDAEESRAIAEMGCALAQAGQLEEARVLFEGLVAGNPEDASFRAALGTVYHKLRRHPEARAEYEAALVLEETNVVALAGRGELRLRLGDPNGMNDLIRALAVDSEGRTAASRRAQELLEWIAEASPQ